MKMISFYPGPSRIESKIPSYVEEAYKSGIVSMNHRSEAFMELLRVNDKLLKKKLNIPEDYTIFYVSSATECWEIVTQSLSVKLGSYHVFNGAFGEKWMKYAKAITGNADMHKFDPQHTIDLSDLEPEEGSVICITQNETSNGSQVSVELLNQLRQTFNDNLIAIDATSSMGGVSLDFSTADIWFASLQKCFGLPSGLAMLICSEKALEISREFNASPHYNSLGFMEENMNKWQTTHTPNILNIYLLNRVMSGRKSIKKVHKKLIKRISKWNQFLGPSEKLHFYIQDQELRSQTVLALEGDPRFITLTKSKALEAGLIIGNGYKGLKETTLRIANFPAIKKREIKYLRDFLKPLLY